MGQAYAPVRPRLQKPVHEHDQLRRARRLCRASWRKLQINSKPNRYRYFNRFQKFFTDFKISRRKICFAGCLPREARPKSAEAALHDLLRLQMGSCSQLWNALNLPTSDPLNSCRMSRSAAIYRSGVAWHGVKVSHSKRPISKRVFSPPVLVQWTHPLPEPPWLKKRSLWMALQWS